MQYSNKHWTEQQILSISTATLLCIRKKKNPCAKKKISYSSPLFLSDSCDAFWPTSLRLPSRLRSNIAETRLTRCLLFASLPLRRMFVFVPRQLRCSGAPGPGRPLPAGWDAGAARTSPGTVRAAALPASLAARRRSSRRMPTRTHMANMGSSGSPSLISRNMLPSLGGGLCGGERAVSAAGAEGGEGRSDGIRPPAPPPTRQAMAALPPAPSPGPLAAPLPSRACRCRRSRFGTAGAPGPFTPPRPSRPGPRCLRPACAAHARPPRRRARAGRGRAAQRPLAPPRAAPPARCSRWAAREREWGDAGITEEPGSPHRPAWLPHHGQRGGRH